MNILHEKEGDIDLLKINGRLDAASAKDLKKQIGALTDAKRIKIVMDMSGCEFIDSSGLGALVSGLRTVTGLGGDIKIAALPDPIRALFELTRLHRVFAIFNDRGAALGSF